jgi:transcriptional regulator with GAF, ATPase, and Fis domain/serine/threonine protein kinase
VLSDRYEIHQGLGEGANAQVYLVTDRTDQKLRAAKVFSANLNALSIARLLDEFKHLSAIEHRGIVKVKDAGRIGAGPLAGRLFLVTDYVAGAELGAHLAACRPEERFRCFARICEEVVDALAYLHGQGLIHGDLSPANVRCDHEGRPVLIDLGLSQAIEQGPSVAGGAFGTLGFVAPEALVGERGPAADLFSLGATLYAAWTGVPPFGVGLESVRRLMEGPAPAPSSLCPGLPAEWDGLLGGLLALSPDQRPASAAHLLREIHRLRPEGASIEMELSIPQPAGDPLAGLLVGRESELRTIATMIEQLAEGSASASVLTISGPAGSGRRTLIRRALRDARLGLLAQTLPAFAIDERGIAALGTDLPGLSGPSVSWDDPARALQSRILALADALEARSQQSPLCVILGPGREEELLAQAVAGGPGNGRLLVLWASEQALRGAADVTLRPLAAADVQALAFRAAGCEPSEPVVEQILRASGGLAAVVALLVRRWALCAREGRADAFRLDRADVDWAHLLDATLAGLSHQTRLWLAHRVFVGPQPQGESDMAIETDAVREAQAAGWWDVVRMTVPTEAHASSVFRAVQQDVRLHGAARMATTTLAEADPRRGEAHFVLGELRAAVACFQAAAAKAAQAGQLSEVAQLALRVLSIDATVGSSAEQTAWATALGLVGQYDAALQLLSSCRPENPEAALELAERRAWLLGRRGDPMAARQVLTSALQEAEQAGPSRSQVLVRARLARLLVSCGLFVDALQVAQPVLEESSTAGLYAREAAALALSYAGRLSEALDLIVALERTVENSPDKPLAARVAALRGLHAQLSSQPEPAALAYREAARRCEELHDRHGLAAATFNLGCVLADIGQFGEALTAFQQALRELGRLGITTDLALALYNTGVLLLQLGDLDAVSRVARRLHEEATATKAQAFMAYSHSLEADLARRKGPPAAAVSLYGAAEQAFAHAGNQPMADASGFSRAEALAESGQSKEAAALWKQIQARSSGGQPSSHAQIEEALLLSRARIVLIASETDDEIGPRLWGLSNAALAQGRKPTAWRAAQLVVRLFERAGDARAAEAQQRAASLFEELTMNTPLQYQAGLHRDPDAPANSFAPQDRNATAQLAERAARAEGRLRRLQRINKRLNSDLRLSRVLEAVIDTAIEMTDAERGFLLLKDGTGDLVVKVARNIDQTTLDAPDFVLSRSIAKQAAEKGEPVVTVDATGDQRFREAVSVSDLHLRSVLAVPLSVKGTVVGTIYVDHRLRKGVFDDDALAMVMDFAEQAAIAIENARLLSELRRRENQVQSLNRRLQHELRIQTQALQGAREELKESRQVAALRYDYRQIIGRTARMQELFRLLDRVTDTALPVVIEGESGTGKELVARAIHYNGPRRERPFVSENCAAIPETLLESTLFGHVKGAFTGAERESRGLFAVADGGTLFLDEVAEMSPGMQGKLLRVLQDGEFHRVGGERPQKVDVRVLVATNKNLERMVSQGKFRQDLFFRISVVRLLLPPLRERSEDIPLLVQHFMQKAAAAAGGAAKSIEPAAMAKLCAYRWPGNVRELENEITRAHAFSGATLTVDDLSPAIRAGADGVVSDEREGLRLKPRVERLERMMIREALTTHDGNQTKAAVALGLSRFGLQKKLQRYRIAT